MRQITSKALFYLSFMIVIAACQPNIKEQFNELVNAEFKRQYPSHYPAYTADIQILRSILKNSTIVVDAKYKSNLLSTLENYLLPKYKRVFESLSKRLDENDKILNKCRYLSNVYQCEKQFTSRHFRVFSLYEKIDTARVNQYDTQYDDLAQIFEFDANDKIDLILDTTVSYWRAFPPWDVLFGLKQRTVNGNPHELVHFMFTSKSDVPFFQEPVAFLLGDYRGDTTRFFETIEKHASELSIDTYIPVKDHWHFPAIVLLDENQKHSFWLFTKTLIKKYDLKSFISLASECPWGSDYENFRLAFKSIYNRSVTDFEKEEVLLLLN
jgi:hypothetical protein